MKGRISAVCLLPIVLCVSGCSTGDGTGGSDEGGSSGGGEFTIPTTCVFEELNGSGMAKAGFISEEGVKEQISFTVVNAELTEVDGWQCERYTSGLQSPKYPGCEQYFNCGPCRWLMTLTSKSQHAGWKVKAYPYDIQATGWEGCESYKYAQYKLGNYSEGGSSSGSGSGTGSTCPSKCQTGAVCCGPPFCSGDCIGSPCC